MEADNQYYFFSAFIRENKNYTSFRLTVYMTTHFLQTTGCGNDEA